MLLLLMQLLFGLPNADQLTPGWDSGRLSNIFGCEAVAF